MDKLRCESCDKEFGSEEALDMHNAAKHEIQKKKPKKPLPIKKIKNWAIFILIVVGIVALIVWGISSGAAKAEECRTAPATEIYIESHTNLMSHAHAQLLISVGGVNQEVPTNIGVLPNIMRPVHTHDSSGKLHIEAPCVRDLTLGDFLDIWGKKFEGNPQASINGQEINDFENYVLKDGDNIFIDY